MMKPKLLIIAALAPGWVIPRIIGTLAWFAAPSISGLIALIAWWTLIAALMWFVYPIIRKRLPVRALAQFI